LTIDKRNTNCAFLGRTGRKSPPKDPRELRRRFFGGGLSFQCNEFSYVWGSYDLLPPTEPVVPRISMASKGYANRWSLAFMT
jgi:hypothetical protein